MKLPILLFCIIGTLLLTESCKKIEEALDPCENISCQNEGSCLDGQCNCLDGFSGVNCEIENLCITTINCLNGGSCLDGLCDCPDGFTGNMCQYGETIFDIDGNEYGTVTIGEQDWLTRDLRATKCNDGQTIPLVSDNTAWEALSTAGYSWYKNDSITQITNGYGVLYNWYTISTCNICPAGWHIPTDEEWTILTDYLGGINVAGGKMKETGEAYWNSPNIEATNESGWSGLPSGDRGANGAFSPFGFSGSWWSSSESSSNVLSRILYSNSGGFSKRFNHDKRAGLSIRCLRD